ncbi:MAG: TolC family protein, partial [Planctomycetia bacterium]|nr:TolC family protein [Planctomycetia bacterium]
TRGFVQRPPIGSTIVTTTEPFQRTPGNSTTTSTSTDQATTEPEVKTAKSDSLNKQKTVAGKIVRVSAVKTLQEDADRRVERPLFDIPSEIPGSDALPLHVPSSDSKESDEIRSSKIEKLYRPLSTVGPGEPTSNQTEWTIAALQAYAFDHSPTIQQAEAQMEAARGTMIQAGLHPNPLVGYEADTVRTLATKGYQGVQITTPIVTGGKLGLQQSAAAMAYENACLAVRKSRADIATQVRDAYFDFLVSQERLRLQRALARFTDNIYRAQIEQVKGGQAAAYEPLQLRVFGSQARNAVAAAENAQRAAWRRLSASLGDPNLEPLHVVGEVDRAVPELNFDSARNYLLETHTDLLSARNSITQSRYLAQLEYIRPRRPDLQVYTAVQHDYTGAPFNTTYNVQVNVPLAIFDRNQGNILQTQALMVASDRAFTDGQNNLTRQLAETFSRYQTARRHAASYRDEILPDQVRVYRGVYARYQQDRQAVNFGDIVVAQQTLGSAVSTYTDALGDQWQAYVDLAGLLQLEDLNQLEQLAGVPTNTEPIVPQAPASDD